MAENPIDNDVKYLKFQSIIDQSFWHKLCQLKLEVDRLEENQREIWGLYLQTDFCSVFVDYTSFNSEVDWKLCSGEYTSLQGLCNPKSRWNFPLVAMVGLHRNFNTLESFKNIDKNEVLSSCGENIKSDIISGKALNNPTLLTRFILLTFSDLKKYDFYYWFSFPASLAVQANYVGEQMTLKNILKESQFDEFFSSHEALLKEQKIVFGVIFEADVTKCVTLQNLIEILNSEGDQKNIYLCYLDPSSTSKYPGWPLRNLLTLISYHWKNVEERYLNVISFRVGPNFLESPVFQISMKVTDKDMTKWVGWEKNTRDKLGPRFTSLKESMDPVRLADSSAELNLKLMKWRLAPELNLEIISKQKVLILGAGTLGCALARNLMCWGVRNVTFIDNGRVSYSNPVRQCLYVINDCLKEKAPAAAAALKSVLPTVRAAGEVLEIPMPGHSTASVNNAERLHSLVEMHDAVFLVTDSRESRWLPTLVAASLGKIAITAALGFDTYLIIRHGMRSGFGDSESEKLGCYFCNDVTAPGDSSTDRSLDQQCTVSRPGVSNIAAALAAELFVSILQQSSQVGKQVSSPMGESSKAKEKDDCILGLVPHSIRGFLSSFNHMTPMTNAFSKCIACSSAIINSYNEDRENFLTRVFESNTYLEEVTGLTELQKLTEEIQDFSLSDESDD